LAVLYSAWNVNGVPSHVLMLVFMKPFAALATIQPVRCVVRSVIIAVNPSGGSYIEIFRTSPPFMYSVCALDTNVEASVSCGLAGPVGTPFLWMKPKLTGSSQFGLQFVIPNWHSRLSIVSAPHH
jgi:hypothetical protein